MSILLSWDDVHEAWDREKGGAAKTHAHENKTCPRSAAGGRTNGVEKQTSGKNLADRIQCTQRAQKRSLMRNMREVEKRVKRQERDPRVGAGSD